MGMTAHLVYDAIDPNPATLSPVMVDLIRQQIGFDGLLMSDDISMKALSGSLGDISRAAIKTGLDVALAERAEVAQAAGEMTTRAQARAETALAARKPPRELDITGVEAELSNLLGGQVYER